MWQAAERQIVGPTGSVNAIIVRVTAVGCVDVARLPGPHGGKMQSVIVR